MNIILILLSVVGSLGVFLFGMKLMSEALQKVAGYRMREILAAITSSKLKSLTTGLIVTAIIQSSSATTVMIVSFVNAGLLSLTEAIGMTFGANIGTTLKAWIFSFVGININISQFALPIVAVSFWFLFSNKGKKKYWGEFAMGFALIFLGLDFLFKVIPDLTSNRAVMDFIGSINDLGVFSIVLFIFIGLIIAATFQSSSTAVVLTLAFSSNGLIDFSLAAAMVIGENIGTTITANLAAIVANSSAKKAARAHFLIKLLGAAWALSVFPFLLKATDMVMIRFTGKSPFTDPSVIPWALAAFHTFFNAINTLILIWFIPVIIKLSSKLVKEPAGGEEKFRLSFISKTIFSTSEISLIQARSELAIYSKRIKAMFKLVRTLFNQTNQDAFEDTFNQIKNYESLCDQMEVEVSTYLTRIGQSELSNAGSEQLKVMLRISGNLESIADNCYNIARTLNKKRLAKIWFTQELRNNINEMLQLIDEAIEIMNENLGSDYSQVSVAKAGLCEDKIDQFRNKLKEEYASNGEKVYRHEAGIIYNDIFTRCERLGDHIFNVTEAITLATEKERKQA